MAMRRFELNNFFIAVPFLSHYLPPGIFPSGLRHPMQRARQNKPSAKR
jgi:hypothetical protein